MRRVWPAGMRRILPRNSRCWAEGQRFRGCRFAQGTWCLTIYVGTVLKRVQWAWSEEQLEIETRRCKTDFHFRFPRMSYNPAMPVERILSKNLLLSASRALTAGAGEVTESNFLDLCTLISLSMLHDSVVTLGNDLERTSSKPSIAPCIEALENWTGGLKIKFAEFDPEKRDAVLAAAIGGLLEHLLLKSTDAKDTTELIKSKIEGCLEFSTGTVPDEWEDFAEGASHFRETRYGRSVAEDFWLRSFLYRGLTKVRQGRFVPDRVRAWGIEVEDGPRTDPATELEELVDGKYYTQVEEALEDSAPTGIPPFAAVVLLRAGKERERIGVEVKKLREDLATPRANLERLEAEIEQFRRPGSLFAARHTPATRSQAKAAFRSALDALEKEVMPLPSGFIEKKELCDLISKSASLLRHAVKLTDWKEIPGLAIETYQWITETSDFRASEDKNAFLEIHHHLGWDLWRSPLGNGKKIELQALFGDFRKESRPSSPAIAPMA
jgi:hypothetical protein